MDLKPQIDVQKDLVDSRKGSGVFRVVQCLGERSFRRLAEVQVRAWVRALN